MNFLKHIKPHVSIKSALSLIILLAVTVSFSTCNFFSPEESASASTPPMDNNSPAYPPDVVIDTPSAETSAPPESVEPVGFTGPDLETGDAVADEFFEDAAFMGNSLMDGFRMFSGITLCDYYAVTSMTVSGATSKICVTLDSGASGTVVDGLTQKPYGKIYILLGINEIGMNVETFAKQYGEMLDIIIAAQPDCDIYIMGLTPVSQAKSASGDTFSMSRIGTYNEALYQLAKDKECYYMDLVAALSDDTGYLPSAETTDGVHFSVNVYQLWAEYVRTHYA